MEFSSTIFIFGFLPIILLIYSLSPTYHKNKVLFFSNLILYLWVEPIFIFLLVFLMVLDFYGGKYIYKFKENNKKKNAVFWSVILINIILFIIFKLSIISFLNMSNIFAKTIIPFGFLIYTFQGLSYVIDIYLKKTRLQTSFIDFGVFMAFFPQLVCGPILRYGDMKLELAQREFSQNKISVGFNLFIKGLSKKIFLADVLLSFWHEVKYLNADYNSIISSWLGIIAFMLGLYFYLCSYSDMARGIGKMFGFDLPLNFNYPFMSKSITEFSRKFNISLISWYKAYIFTPIGNNFSHKNILYIRLFLVWILIGIWYDASLNLILWGAFLGIIMILENLFLSKILLKIPRFIQHIYTLSILLLSFILFAFNSLPDSFGFLKGLFYGKITDKYFVSIHNLLFFLPIIIFAIICSTNFLNNFLKKLEENNPNVIKWTRIISDLFLTIICLIYVIAQNFSNYDISEILSFL